MLLPGLYKWGTWYNAIPLASNAGAGQLLYENKLLGVPRIRQLRVRNNSCTVPTSFQNDIQARGPRLASPRLISSRLIPIHFTRILLHVAWTPAVCS